MGAAAQRRRSSPKSATAACSPGDLLAARVAPGHVIMPPTLVEIENTHNRAGGVVFPQDEAARVCGAAREHGMASYLDGARLWNAEVATGVPAATLAAPFDLVSVAFSKGLGAPGGSMLAGPRATIAQAVRHRRIFGGAMRQVGIFAAAASFALDHHGGQLATDHANAAVLAKRLTSSSRIVLDLSAVQTNIVVFRLSDEAPDAATSHAGAGGGVLLLLGPHTLRAVTHHDVTRDSASGGDVLVRSWRRMSKAFPTWCSRALSRAGPAGYRAAVRSEGGVRRCGHR
jgi:threonine aldolase